MLLITSPSKALLKCMNSSELPLNGRLLSPLAPITGSDEPPVKASVGKGSPDSFNPTSVEPIVSPLSHKVRLLPFQLIPICCQFRVFVLATFKFTWVPLTTRLALNVLVEDPWPRLFSP